LAMSWSMTKMAECDMRWIMRFSLQTGY